MNKAKTIFLFFTFSLSCFLNAQVVETRYGIATTFDDKTTVSYDENYGSLILNSGSGDITFSTDLARLKTLNKRVDSLLTDLEKIPLTFKANLAQGLFAIVNEENDETYHRLVGTLVVNNQSYNAEALVRVNNFVAKSDISKALLDMSLEIDPKKVTLPVLSDYFSNVLLFQITDGIINQNN